jgi:hypothetical protein
MKYFEGKALISVQASQAPKVFVVQMILLKGLELISRPC